MTDGSPALIPGGEVFETQVALRWGDMDSLGHVNNAVSLSLLEEGRVRFLLALGSSSERDFGLVAARHEIDYLRPLFYSLEPLTLRIWIERVGTSSFTFGCVVVDGTGDPAVKARTVVVSVRPDGTGSAPLPDDTKSVLARFLPPVSAARDSG